MTLIIATTHLACSLYIASSATWTSENSEQTSRNASGNVGPIQRLEISTTYSSVSEPCEKTYCAWGATCVVSEGKALCQCPTDCPLTPDPVCGSDDVTYASYCHLRQISCQKRKNTRVKHQEACGECLLLFLTRASGKMNRGGNRRELRIWHRNDHDACDGSRTGRIQGECILLLRPISFSWRVRKMRIYLAASEIIRACVFREYRGALYAFDIACHEDEDRRCVTSSMCMTIEKGFSRIESCLDLTRVDFSQQFHLD